MRLDVLSPDRYIPMGSPVLVYVEFQDRTLDESPWIFDISRASDPRTRAFEAFSEFLEHVSCRVSA
jgi:hypothetical protein